MSSKTFLREFCESILDRYGSEGLKDLTIVIPSQRVALYIREELVDLVSVDFWMPKILPINSFLESLHDFVVIDELEVVFELYEAYQETFDSPESLDDFLSWSSMIISDFNDIDKYLLNVDQVFKNLQSIKDIESWSFNQEELSETQKKFMKFWEQLGDLYHAFQARLNQKGEITNSMIYRVIAEEPERYLSKVENGVFFVGFNALSIAEEKIMKFLVNAGVGEVVWDADNYYLSNNVMEAGRFIRKYRSWSGSKDYISKDNLANKKKEIRIYGANSNLQQVVIASQLMSDLSSKQMDSVSLVFSDESLLKPMLNVLPKTVGKLNVAMGYPLNSASIFSFFEEIIQVQLNIERYKNKGYVYYKDFIRVSEHEIFQTFTMPRGISTLSINRKISKENYAYLPVDLLKSELGDKFLDVMFFFVKAESVAEFMTQLIEFLKGLYQEMQSNVLERESVMSLVYALEKLLSVQKKYDRVKQFTTFNQLVRQLLRSLKVSFLGEPLEGVQLLGLLETRALDFDHVILLSCNEDILPKRVFSNTLIPYDLRQYLGLPTTDDKEAIFAYYFYRLIQRAEKIDLVYNAGESDGLQANEISRYLLQLEQELQGEELVVRRVGVEVEKKATQRGDSNLIENDNDIRARLIAWFEKGISASGINQFNTCPRNFVYTQLMGVAQNEEIEEDIESSTYGTIVHEVLENLYKRAGKIVGLEQIEIMKKEIEAELRLSFDKRFPGGNYKTGKNLLLYETAIHTLKKYLDSEKRLIEERGIIRILGLEVKLEKEIVLSTSAGEIKLKIKGMIDRVDEIGGQVRVIDYKTGRVDDLNFKGDWSKLTNYQVQLMTYLYLYRSDKDVVCGMISFKELSKGLQGFNFSGESVFNRGWIGGEFVPKFEEYLIDFVENVLASEFEHNPKSKYCVMC